jgi:very-short-patch-repair endonuclease
MSESDLNDFFSARARGGARIDGLTRQAFESLLRSRALRSHHFGRQREIGPYVVDYVCSEYSLILELRGAHSSDTPTSDATRTAFLSGLGYTVLRIPASEVLRRPASVVKRIRRALG